MLYIAWSEVYKYRLPEKHRFPMEKYDLIPAQLIYEGTITDNQIIHPLPMSYDIILMTHTYEYVQKLIDQSLSTKEIRQIGFPLTEELVYRGRCIANGTLECMFLALTHGVSINTAGGTHHSFSERGEGFCVFNDIAIATNYLLQTNSLNKVLIIDLDVHQGNGTASIFEGRCDVFTFSMHGQNNYPHRKMKSNLDVGLPDGCTDDVYLHVLEAHLPNIIEQFGPDGVFYIAGVDVLATDKLGRLCLSVEGYAKRDAYVLEMCKQYNVPLCVTMGGGYSPDIKHILEAHCNTYRLAQEIYF